MASIPRLRRPLVLALLAWIGCACMPAMAQDTPTAESRPQDVPIPKKLPPPATDDNGPTVTIRSSDNGDRVEEYREAGKIYMVRIVPVRGKPYYLYDDDRNGRLDRSDADRHTIAPVYWTVYEWD